MPNLCCEPLVVHCPPSIYVFHVSYLPNYYITIPCNMDSNAKFVNEIGCFDESHGNLQLVEDQQR